MHNKLLSQVKEYIKHNNKRWFWKKIAGGLACIVVFCTIYALILPAVTMEQQAYCGLTEHTHSEGCYTQGTADDQKKLVCSKEILEIHEHVGSCYDEEGNLLCGLADYIVHSHDEICYDSTDNLICSLPEIQQHIHTDDCNDNGCTLTEVELHTHTEECYTDDVLTCGKLQVLEHIHTEDCFVNKTVLICEMAEHTHNLACYSDSTADVETESDWEGTLPEITGCWADDMIAIAENQIGYTESVNNYVVLEDGITTKGYTRYGQWYGDPYGDWNLPFVLFCMNYGEVAEEAFPRPEGDSDWIKTLTESDLYQTYNSYIPNPGDLVFLESEQEVLVGIVSEVTENGEIKAIIGDYNENKVSEEELDPEIVTILGYGTILRSEAMVLDLTDTTELDTEISEDPVYYCGIEDHVHTEECLIQNFNIENPNTEDTDVENSTNTTVGNATDAEGSLDGVTMYHSPLNQYHQHSSHRLDGDEIVTFMLTPEEDFSDSWVPNTKEWTAKSDANYIVAYCADYMIFSGKEGVDYRTYVLDDSRISDEATRSALEGILAHSYPYISADEMRTQLSEAYKLGITDIDLSCCGENEFITAVQWAIWDTTMLAEAGLMNGATEASFVESIQEKCWNPLTDVGHTNESEYTSHIKAIRDYLVSQTAPEEMWVEEFSSDYVLNEDGTYDLKVTVSLNREIRYDETIETQLVASKKQTEMQKLETGTQSYILTLEGLSAKEMSETEVKISISGEHIQMYYFDSDDYQDMIAGNWEYYYNNLSFNVGIETTSVSVTKYWTDNEPGAEFVTVQLLANGTSVGDPVKLSAKNNWSYTWTKLVKEDVLGNDIVYDIHETPIDGYYSSLEELPKGEKTVQIWKETDTIEPGGKYVLLSAGGALAYERLNNREGENDGMAWASVNLANPDDTAKNAIWNAEAVAGNTSGFYLSNANMSNLYIYDSGSLFYLSSSKSELYYVDGLLSSRNSSGTDYYLGMLYSGGEAYRRSDKSYAVSFTAYKLVEVTVTTSDINFILTNTKYNTETDSDTVDVVVTKNWEGRPDSNYPLTATVQLMQNGRAYGGTVELSAENNWEYTWTRLPVQITDSNGISQDINYTVTEVELENYTVTCVEDEQQQYSFTLTNKWEPDKVAVELQKLDAETSEFLPGAQFDVYLTTNSIGTTVPGTSDVKGVLTESVLVGDDGKLVLSLAVGETYYLVETKAPDGYNKLSEAIGLTVTKRGTRVTLTLLSSEDLVEVTSGTSPVLKVKNKEGYILPETGGIGTTPYTIAGWMLLSGGAYLMNRKRRRMK